MGALRSQEMVRKSVATIPDRDPVAHVVPIVRQRGQTIKNDVWGIAARTDAIGAESAPSSGLP